MWHIVPGDWILVCSDGLVNMVKDPDICAEFRKSGSAAEIAARLVNLANENGGKDNITVITSAISPSPFLLIYFKLRSIKRRHGYKLLWFVVSAVLGLAGFVAGYLYYARGGRIPMIDF